MKKVYITNGAFNNYIEDMFTSRGFELVASVEDADILCLSGGADINPQLYGETKLAGTYFNERRDASEIADYNRAVERGLFIFGICRGGQLANVLNGGRLWQHFEGHRSDHTIVDIETGREIVASSIHHQMFRPTPEAVIVATCNHATLKVAEHEVWNARDGKPDDDVEVCWYSATRSLCIQGHPEVGPDQFTDYCFELMERFA